MRNARMQGLKIEEVVPPVCPQGVADGTVTLVGTGMASKSAVISSSCPSRSTVLRASSLRLAKILRNRIESQDNCDTGLDGDGAVQDACQHDGTMVGGRQKIS